MTQDLKSLLDGRHRLAALSGTDAFEKARVGVAAAEQIRATGLYPFFREIDVNEGPEAVVDGKRVLMFGSNNYLGLTAHPRVRAAAIEAIARHGTSLTGSRLLNGTLNLHRELESKLAAFLDKEACLVFTTGYQANLGVLQALVTKGVALVLDHRAHASLFDATRLCDGETYMFRHGDPTHFEHVLTNIGRDRAVLVALEGVFSMEGDVIDLPVFVEIARRHGARILLDDAHGLGVHGREGRGTADLFGVTEAVDLIVGTFSKSLASIGGFVAGPAAVIDFIQHMSRPFVFTASLPPASIAAALAALEVMQSESDLVPRLQANVERFRAGLERVGLPVGQRSVPILPVLVGDEVRTMQMWRALLDDGLYVNAALMPAVPRGRALLRTSVMASHDAAQIDRAVTILEGASRRLGVLGSEGS